MDNNLERTLKSILRRLTAIERTLADKPKKEDPVVFVNARRACQLTGLSLPALYTQVSRGNIGCVKKPNGRLTFNPAELARFMRGEEK